jgi:hypothetical protein
MADSSGLAIKTAMPFEIIKEIIVDAISGCLPYYTFSINLSTVFTCPHLLNIYPAFVRMTTP